MMDGGPVAAGDGVARWRRIADALEADIVTGRLAAHERLPTEADLATRFGVNRHTVRRALAALAAKGLVRAQQGSGTFVEPPPLAYPIGPRTRFSEIVAGAGREASGDLIATREVPASATLATLLGVTEGAPLLLLTTRHRADGVPISWSQTHLPLPRFRDAARHYAASGSLTQAFRACGLADYLRRSTKIAARLARPDDCEMLDLAPGRPVLVIESLNVDIAGVPIQVTRATFSADRVELTVAT